MSSTDDRIVKMQFDNQQFMKGAADTQKALADTNKAVDGAGKTRGLLDLSSQMGSVGVTASRMAVITTTALATIANKVVNVGINMAKSLTLDPLTQGFSEYEALLTKQNVIMNATGKSAGEVKGYLNQLNTYSDRTIYSFGNMTDAIQKFVNAGVPLKTSVTTIKGIANAAAFAGASSEEANRAMYAFSQSMSLGFVQLQDWNQIENANMGTIKFKEQLLQAGVAAGTLTQQGKNFVTSSGRVISATKGWRDGLQDQWATTEVLNGALSKYADTNTKLGKQAFKSATQVRTFSAFMDTLKESIGSGWSGIFTALIGNLDQSTSMWTSFAGVTGNAVSAVFNFGTKALTIWRKMGGFEKTIQGFKNILSPFGALLHAIGDAWSAAFPSTGKKGPGKALYGLSAAFELITRPLTWLAKGIPAITPILTAFFMAIHNGGVLIGSIVHFVVDFFTTAMDLVDLKAPNAGGFLGFVQSIIDVVKTAAQGVGDLINKGKGLGSMFGGIKMPKLSLPDLPSMPSLPSLPSFGGAGDKASAATSAVKGQASAMGDAMSKIQSIAVKMGDVFNNMWDHITGFFKGFNMEDVVQAFNLAVLSTLSLSVSRFLNTMSKSFKGFAEVGPALTETIGKAGGALKAFQTQAKAKIILNIGIALGILAASLWLLSKIPAKDLAKGLAAMSALTLMLNVSMKAFSKTIDSMSKGGTTGKTLALSVAMIALAGSMILLSTALILMNHVDWTSLVKGLGSMIVMMKVLEGLGNLGAHAAKNLLAGSVAIGLTAGAMIVLAGALLLFKLVDWGSMAKAGVALLGITLAVGALALIPYEGIAKVGIALLTASVGMLAIANALVIFALVKWESIGKAAVILGLLTLALGALMIVGGPISSAMFISLAAGMVGLALACLMLNKVDWSSIGKAALVLGILLVAIAAGAAILTVFLYAVAPLAPVLLMIAGGFALLGIGLLAFSAALALAMSLAAAGTAAFAALATAAAVAVAVFIQSLALQAPIMSKSVLIILQSIIDTVVKAVPMIIQGFKDLFKAIGKEIGSPDKKKSFGDTAKGWLTKLLDVAKTYIPKAAAFAVNLVLTILQKIASKIGEFATAGANIVIGFLNGIAKKAGEIIDAGVNLVVKLIEGIGKNAEKMAKAGIQLIADFLHATASAIRTGASAIGGGLVDIMDAMKDVGVNMVKGLISGITSMAGDAIGKVKDLGGSMISAAKGAFKIFSPSRVFKDIGKFVVMGLTQGIQQNAASAIIAVASMVTGAIAVADDYVSAYFQKLDQQSIAARARAEGLQAAAAKAQKSANKTKEKNDDKAANALSKRAKAAAKQAAKEEKAADKARELDRKKKEFEKADSAGRAEIRAKEAQAQLAAAKNAEKDAEAARVQSEALREQAKKAGSAAERKRLQKEAERMRKQAIKDAKKANKLLEAAATSSTDALKYQQMAGEEAAAAFQKQFEAEAKADADAAAFDKLSNSEKAALRRQQAADLQAKAEADLAKAKELAYTDLAAANDLAQQALAEADQARQFLDEANGFGGGDITGGVVMNLDQTDAAAAAYNRYSDLYDSAVAAAAAGTHLEFNQYNSSPESLSDAEIYRNTNNQLTFATDKLADAAA